MQGYLQTIWEQFDWQGLLSALQRVLGVLLCLTVHETSHGLAAYALGDPTARERRRLSLNPLRHIDWLGLASSKLHQVRLTADGDSLVLSSGPSIYLGTATLQGERTEHIGTEDAPAEG